MTRFRADIGWAPSRSVTLAAFILPLLAGVAQATLGPIPMSLKGVSPPEVPGLLDGPEPIVINKSKAIVLGKALFWDTNVGSDGMACASCHFHAGADRRIKNQVAPGGQAVKGGQFEPGQDAHRRGANYRLKRGDFPLNQANVPLREIDNHGFLRVSDDVVGSAGAFGGAFRKSELMETVTDDCVRTPDELFHVRGVGARRVTDRNAPTVINAVFNHRNFWDGRANNVFNGSSPWGDRDPDAGVWVKQSDGTLVKQRLRLLNASLASQAVAPPTNSVEMSCTGRAFADLGRKLQIRQPLENQRVHWQDGVLGPYSLSKPNEPRRGLNTYYYKLVRQAFNPKYWSSTKRGPFGKPRANSPEERPLPYNQLEANFSMFFALAIQLYESTLVSDDSPFDRSRRDSDGNPIDLSPSQQRGMQIFRTAHCAMCHVGPVFTSAAIQTNAALLKYHPEAFGNAAFRVSASNNVVTRESGLTGHGFVDTGFAATGVGSDEWDIGLGGQDVFGNPLSFAEQYLHHLAGDAAGVLDPGIAEVRACDLTIPIALNRSKPLSHVFVQGDGIQPQTQGTDGCFKPAGAFVPTREAAMRELADPASRKMLTVTQGAFKIPSLRNIELTGPYTHNGGMGSLEEVVEFYARGGNFDGAGKQFALVFPQPDLQLDAGQREDLINFLKSLTDDRVRFERAPFDHPEITLPVGQRGDHLEMASGNTLDAALAPDEIEVIPAVGMDGLPTPLKPFEEYLDE